MIDTNAVIDFLDNKLPEKSAIILETTLFQISVITRIELLAWPNATIYQDQILNQFITSSQVHGLDESVILKSIALRKSNKIKLPDAIIAATALEHV